jgi:hypothetical protein
MPVAAQIKKRQAFCRAEERLKEEQMRAARGAEEGARG